MGIIERAESITVLVEKLERLNADSAGRARKYLELLNQVAMTCITVSSCTHDKGRADLADSLHRKIIEELGRI